MPLATFIPHFLPSQTTPTVKPTTCALRLNPVPTVAYIAYMSDLFLFPPTPSVPSKALAEATNLSLNFAYLIPTFFPNLTAANHPMLEAIFHIVVSWALLLLAFVSDSTANDERFSPPAAPFLIGAAFLTNIFYLPYLALRRTDQPSFQKLNQTALLKFAESRTLPIISISLLLASLGWGVFGRPEFGDFATRLLSFRQVVENDILAYSFVVDTLVFSLFQAWIVPDDAKRRQWSDEAVRDRAVVFARVPFFGLAVYLFTRAGNARLQWLDDS